MANDASTYAVTLIGPSTFKVNDKSMVPKRYPMPLCNFALSSSVGDCTLVVRKATSVRPDSLAELGNFATEWKHFASGIQSGGDSLTSKRFSSAGVVEKVASPYSFIRSSMNPGFPITTTPGC